jgi:hypothetical protein
VTARNSGNRTKLTNCMLSSSTCSPPCNKPEVHCRVPKNRPMVGPCAADGCTWLNYTPVKCHGFHAETLLTAADVRKESATWTPELADAITCSFPGFVSDWTPQYLRCDSSLLRKTERSGTGHVQAT